MPTPVADTMQAIADRARAKADRADHPDPRATGRPSGAIKMPRPSTIPEPDSKDPAVLRWGRIVVEHLTPEEGSILVLKAPSGERYDEQMEAMYESISTVLQEAGIEPVAVLAATPAFSIAKLDRQTLARFGYVYDPSTAKQHAPPTY